MQFTKSLLSKVIVMVVLSSIMITAQSFAQDSGKSYDLQQKKQESINFSEQELKKFAKAHAQVNTLQKEYSKKLRQTKNEERAKAMQDNYIQKMKTAIEKEGISIRKYNQIMQAANSNQELSRKIQKMVK